MAMMTAAKHTEPNEVVVPRQKDRPTTSPLGSRTNHHSATAPAQTGITAVVRLRLMVRLKEEESTTLMNTCFGDDIDKQDHDDDKVVFLRDEGEDRQSSVYLPATVTKTMCLMTREPQKNPKVTKSAAGALVVVVLARYGSSHDNDDDDDDDDRSAKKGKAYTYPRR
jgi:hypothetical protein